MKGVSSCMPCDVMRYDEALHGHSDRAERRHGKKRRHSKRSSRLSEVEEDSDEGRDSEAAELRRSSKKSRRSGGGSSHRCKFFSLADLTLSGLRLNLSLKSCRN